MGQELQGTSLPSCSSSPLCRHSGGSSGMGRRSSSRPCPTSTRSSTAWSACGTPSPSSPTASSWSPPSTPSAPPSSSPTPPSSSPTPTPRKGYSPPAPCCPSLSLTQLVTFLLQLKVLVVLAGVFCVFALIVYVSMVLFDHKPRRTFVGYLSVASLIFMFASPLSIINLVIRTKSVEYMPFYLSLSMSLMSVSFFAYGALLDDFFIYVPNGVGTVLGVVQLLLYAYYRKVSRDEARRPLLVTHT